MERVRKYNRKDNFTTVFNDYLQDKNLSWKAKGIITYVRSLPPDWELNLSDLKNRSKDGRDATANGMKELIDNGYCSRIRLRDKAGVFLGYAYEVSDVKISPQTENPFMDSPKTGNPKTENPKTDKPFTENPTQVNTNNSKETFTVNTNSKPPETKFSGSLFPDDDVKEKSKEVKTLFRNSKYEDLELFLKQFDTPDYANIDMVFYYHSVSDWSDSSNTKRTPKGWLATARTFIRKDAEKNKIRYKPGHTPENQKFNVSGAMEFLNEEY